MQQHITLFVYLGVTSRAIPEKKGVKSILGEITGLEPELATVLVDTPVTKSSLPTLDHRLLVIGGRHSRAGEGVHIPLGLEQIDDSIEVTICIFAKAAPPPAQQPPCWSPRQRHQTSSRHTFTLPTSSQILPLYPLLIPFTKTNFNYLGLQNHLAFEMLPRNDSRKSRTVLSSSGMALTVTASPAWGLRITARPGSLPTRC